MTSPAIQSNDKAQRKTRKESDGPSEHSLQSTSNSTTIASIAPSNSLFAWLRIFRLVDSLMRQGC